MSTRRKSPSRKPAPALPAVAVDPAAPPPSVEHLVQAGAAVGRLWLEQLERAVLRMRMHGSSWAEVGRALGVSKQAALKRFGPYCLEHCEVHIVRVPLVGGGYRSKLWSPVLEEDLPDPRVAGRQLRAQTHSAAIVRNLLPLPRAAAAGDVVRLVVDDGVLEMPT